MEREIRILLVGKTGSGKSSVGNLMIGEKRFKVHRNGATTESTLEKRRLTNETVLVIVDTPGYENGLLPKEKTEMELIRGMDLLKPGPHFIIATKSLKDRVTGNDVEWFKQFQARYSQNMRNIIPVFTGTDALEEDDISLDQYLENSPAELRQMLKSIGDHTQIGGKANQNDERLVREILDRILNRYQPENFIDTSSTYGMGYESDFVAHSQRNVKETRKRTIDSSEKGMTSFIGKQSQRNIILLGKSGIGKSSVGNILFGEKVFKTSYREERGTQECQVHIKDGITVVDTPGYFSSLRSDEDTAKGIIKTLHLYNLPIHVFILVLSADIRFTGDEQQSLGFIKTLFGENMVQNMMMVFTGKDNFEDLQIEFKVPSCLPEIPHFLINAKTVSDAERRPILVEISNSRYKRSIDVQKINESKLDVLRGEEDERQSNSRRRVGRVSGTINTQFNLEKQGATNDLWQSDPTSVYNMDSRDKTHRFFRSCIII